MDVHARTGNENGYHSTEPCLTCGHTENDHDMRFDRACWHDGGMCDCSMFEEVAR